VGNCKLFVNFVVPHAFSVVVGCTVMDVHILASVRSLINDVRTRDRTFEHVATVATFSNALLAIWLDDSLGFWPIRMLRLYVRVVDIHKACPVVTLRNLKKKCTSNHVFGGMIGGILVRPRLKNPDREMQRKSRFAADSAFQVCTIQHLLCKY
jgi:hypothetical protein